MPSPMTHHTTCTHNAVTRQPVTECVLIWRHHLTQTYDITLFYSTMCLRGLISSIIHRVYILAHLGAILGALLMRSHLDEMISRTQLFGEHLRLVVIYRALFWFWCWWNADLHIFAVSIGDYHTLRWYSEGRFSTAPIIRLMDTNLIVKVR